MIDPEIKMKRAKRYLHTDSQTTLIRESAYADKENQLINQPLTCIAAYSKY